MPTIREVLNTVANGGLSRQRDRDEDFEEVLAVVQDLDKQGYLLGPNFHRSSTSSEGEIDFFAVLKLSELGRQKLAELT